MADKKSSSTTAGPNASGFWTELLTLLEGGTLTSDPDYYKQGGGAQEGEWGNVIGTLFANTAPGSTERKQAIELLKTGGFWEDTDDLEYWNNFDGDEADLASLKAAAEKRLPGMFDSSGNLAVDADPDFAGGDDDVIDPVGAVEGEYDGVMAGGTLHRVKNPGGQEDYYVIAYEYPKGSGHSFYYRFDSIESLQQAIGPNMGGGDVPIGAPIDEAVVRAWTDGGNASEIAGVGGSFDGYMEDIIYDAAVAAGLDDPTLLGEAMKDPGIQLLMGKAHEGEWTPAQVKAAMRQEPFYTDVLYPGIDNFYGMGNDPEGMYQQYKQNVDQIAKKLGLDLDTDGSYKSIIEDLLDSGVSDVALATWAPVYQKAQANVGYAESLSKWTEKITGTAVNTFEDYFDILAGNAPAEMLEIAELAGMQYMADNQGFEISDVQLATLGAAVNLSEEQAGQVFSNTTRNLMALGNRGLRRGDLTMNEILEAEAGFSSTGANIDKIKLKMRKLAEEEGIADDPTATIFTDFNAEGAPVKAGLKSGVSEGA